MSDERRKFRADALQENRRRPRRREVLIVTSAVSNLIREAKTFQIPSIMQVGRSVGMVGLNDALMDLVAKKLVASEEAHSKSVDKMGFEALLKRAGIDTKFTTAAKEG